MTGPLRPLTDYTDDELEREIKRLRGISPSQPSPASNSEFASLSDDDLNAEIEQLKRQRGAGRGFLDVLTALPKNVSALGTDFARRYEENRKGSPFYGAALLNTIGEIARDATDSTAEQMTDPVGLAKGMWNSTIGVFNDATELTADWLLDQFAPDREANPHAQWWQKGKGWNLSEEERYAKARNVGVNTAGYIAGIAIGRQVGKRLFSGTAKELGLSSTASLREIAETFTDRAPEEVIGALSATQSGAKEFIKRTLQEGGGGGMIAAMMDPAIHESDDPFRDLFIYGLTGTILATPFEGLARRGRQIDLGKGMLFGKFLDNQTRLITPEKSIELTQAVLNEADPIAAMIEHMNPYARFVGSLDQVDGKQPTLRGLEARHRDNLAVFTDPKTGKESFILVGKKIPDLAEMNTRLASSQVRRPNGKLIRMYHGTPGGDVLFDKPDPSVSSSISLHGFGSYFTEDPTIAGGVHDDGGNIVEPGYAFGRSTDPLNPPKVGPRVIASYLDIRNPFDLDKPITPDIIAKLDLTKLSDAVDETFDLIAKNDPELLEGIDIGVAKQEEIFGFTEWLEKVKRMSERNREFTFSDAGGINSPGDYTINVLNRLIKNSGFDGLTHIGGSITGNPPHRVYIAFDPSQIHTVFDYQPTSFTKATLQQFRDYGYFKGMEVEYNGKSYAVEARHAKSGKVMLRDIDSGEKKIVGAGEFIKKPTGNLFKLYAENTEAFKNNVWDIENADQFEREIRKIEVEKGNAVRQIGELTNKLYELQKQADEIISTDPYGHLRGDSEVLTRITDEIVAVQNERNRISWSTSDLEGRLHNLKKFKDDVMASADPDNLPVSNVNSIDEIVSTLPREEQARFTDMVEYHKYKQHTANESIVEQLTANGFFISKINSDGTIVIKHQADPSILHTVDPKQLKNVTRELTTPMDIGELVKDIQKPYLSPPPTNAAKYTPEGVRRGRSSEIFHKFVSSPIVQYFTPLMSKIADIDRKYKINLTPEVMKLKDAITQEVAASNPHRLRLRRIIDNFRKLPEEQKIHWQKYMETMSPFEWRQRGVYGQRPSASEIAIVDRLIGKGLTAEQRRLQRLEADPNSNPKEIEMARFSVEQQIADGLAETPFSTTEQRQRVNAYVTELEWLTNEMDPTTPDGGPNPIFLDRLNKLVAKYQVEGLDHIVETFQMLRSGEMAGSIYNILRGAEIIQDGGLSRADYAKKNGLDASFQKIMHDYESAMRLVGEQVGIDPRYMIGGYFPHYARYNPKHINLDTVGKDRTIPNDVRGFASKMTRTGFFGDNLLLSDIGDVTTRYINGAFRNMYRDPMLLNLRKKIQEVINMDVPDPNFPEGTATVKPYQMVDRGFNALYDQIESAAKGVDVPSDLLAASSHTKLIARLTGNEKNAIDASRMWMQYMEFKAQGYKPLAAVRDFTSFTQFYGMAFGPRRLANLMRVMSEAGKYREDMIKSGLISTIEPTMIGEGTQNIGVGNKILKGFENLSEHGFKWSFQPQIYKAAHAASYVETTQWVSEAINDFTSKKISQKEFRERIDLEMYDEPQIAMFEKAMEGEHYSNAVDILARQTAHLTLGEYTRMTASQFALSKAGRFFGQFSTWPFWALNASGKLLTRGSRASRVKRAAYIAATFMAADHVAEETGLDFKNWLVNPLSFFPQGSPALQIAQDVSEFMEASGFRRQAMLGTLKNSAAYIANPFPLGFTNILEAVQRYDEGQPSEIVLFRLLGGRVNNKLFEKPSIWD